jgi:predicted nucleic acid-binding protein
LARVHPRRACRLSFVLDSSVAISWCFKDEETPETIQTLTMAKTEAIFVPALWYIETSNVLGFALRKGRLSQSDLMVAVDTLNALEIHPDQPVRLKGFSVLLPLMRKYELTAYDATYLELAMRLDIPLATLDKKLAIAATQAGISLIIASI